MVLHWGKRECAVCGAIILKTEMVKLKHWESCWTDTFSCVDWVCRKHLNVGLLHQGEGHD